MRHFVSVLMFALTLTASAAAQDIRGSGSTFIYAVMTKWAETYQKAMGAQITYQPIGSARGVIEISHEIVDFAVSEAPLNDAQLLRDGLAQFPLVIGAIVPVVNLDGISAGQLRVTGPLLADIYLGKITKWNDPAIAAVNPGLNLPDLPILVVHRSDGSGSSFIWADYLSKVSQEWKVRVGANTTVAWPVGVGVRHNSGIAESVARVRGAIGYVDYGYAVREKLAYTLIRNQAGTFITPEIASFEAATSGVDWAKERGFDISLTNGPAANAYPVMAISFAVIRKYPKDLARADRMRAFFRWALKDGGNLASSLRYLPLPPSLVQQVEGYWESETH